MTITVQDICDAIETWAPASLAYEWDKVGLSIGNPRAQVTRVLACLTVTRDTYRAARKAGAQMLVSHHPLIWEPLKALRPDLPHTRLCLDFVQAGIACFAAHTNLDAAPNGVNAALAEALGLRTVRPLLPVPHARQVKLVTFVPDTHLARLREALSEAGAGVIGSYAHCSFSTPGTGTFRPGNSTNPFSGTKGAVNEEPERRFETLVPKSRLAGVLDALFAAHPYEEVAYDIIPLENRDPAIGLGMRGALERTMSLDGFARRVCKALALDHVRIVGAAKTRVRHVAVLGGAGGAEVNALPDDIDVYVTGDVKYHDAQAALDRGLAVIDAGHAGTEQVIVPVIARYLRGRFEALKVTTFEEPVCFRVLGR